VRSEKEHTKKNNHHQWIKANWSLNRPSNNLVKHASERILKENHYIKLYFLMQNKDNLLGREEKAHLFQQWMLLVNDWGGEREERRRGFKIMYAFGVNYWKSVSNTFSNCISNGGQFCHSKFAQWVPGPNSTLPKETQEIIRRFQALIQLQWCDDVSVNNNKKWRLKRNGRVKSDWEARRNDRIVSKGVELHRSLTLHCMRLLNFVSFFYFSWFLPEIYDSMRRSKNKRF
jgi:hypothetical protein